MQRHTFFALLASMALNAPVMAQDKVLNIYSARHYPTDEALYADFTKATGIKINRVDADDAGILARLKAEGAASPADVILLAGKGHENTQEVAGVKHAFLDHDHAARALRQRAIPAKGGTP